VRRKQIDARKDQETQKTFSPVKRLKSGMEKVLIRARLTKHNFTKGRGSDYTDLEIGFLAKKETDKAEGRQQRILKSLTRLYQNLEKHGFIESKRKAYTAEEIERWAKKVLTYADLVDDKEFRTEIRFITRGKGTSAEGLLKDLKRLLWEYKREVIRKKIGEFYISLKEFKSIKGSAKDYSRREIIYFVKQAIDSANRLRSEKGFQVAMAHITGGISISEKNYLWDLKRLLWLYREAVIEIRRKRREINIEDRILPEDPYKRWELYENSIKLARKIIDQNGDAVRYEVNAGFLPKNHPLILKYNVRGLQRSRRWVPYFVDKNKPPGEAERVAFNNALVRADDVASPYYFFTQKEIKEFYRLEAKKIIHLWSLLDGRKDEDEKGYEEYAIFGFEHPSDTTLGLWTFSVCEVRDTLITAKEVEMTERKKFSKF